MDPARTLDLEEKKADTADTLLQVKKALAAEKGQRLYYLAEDRRRD